MQGLHKDGPFHVINQLKPCLFGHGYNHTTYSTQGSSSLSLEALLTAANMTFLGKGVDSLV